jgi:SAM-dependent methyltransferase
MRKSPALDERAYQEQFELENEHWWFEGRRAVIWSLLRRTGPVADLRVLDAGCGTGRNLIEFGALGTAQGVDSSPQAIELCRRRGVPGVSQASVEDLSFAARSFDLILATDVLEHLPDDRAALAELHRVTAPGGRLMATVPAYQWLWSAHDDAHHHFRRYTLRRLRANMRAAGWDPVAWSYFNATLLAPIAAVRLVMQLRRTAARNGRPDLELTPPALNWMLTQPMRLEAALIGRGVHIPAGVSIGMVCRATKVRHQAPAPPVPRAEPRAARSPASARGARR